MMLAMMFVHREWFMEAICDVRHSDWDEGFLKASARPKV